ncbi:MAG: gliding motility-associated C-terminal domain-containing protein, partial [Bacteroidia bacterium]|nr:gliding motility-associated C-terminal domain-containing protein [Bacteroidia bacterium]
EAYPEQSGTYEVIGIISGCATFPAFAEVDIIPTPVPFLGNDTVFCIRGNPLVLEPGDYSSYEWQDGSTASSFLIQEAGNYGVTVTDAFGCVGEDDISIMEQCPTQVYVPNAFSPNADGINDEFQILGNDIISSRLIVFDRWGNIVFEGEHTDEIWNGTFNGKQAPTGTYIWILHLEGYSADGSIFQEVQKGNINLVR